jgi:putative phage-type endonuclease
VTASDVPTICGECPYSTRRAVLFKKALRLKSVDTEATLHGRSYESVAIDMYRERTGFRVDFAGNASKYAQHPVNNWLGGTVDGIATRPSDGARRVIEVKCPLSRTIREGEIPSHYIGQVQTYMYIHGMDECDFVQYRPAGVRRPEQFMITNIKRDPSYMASRLRKLKQFHNELLEWSAYTERIVTVIQRAWRAYLAKRACREAARAARVMHLKCAHVVGKMAGFAVKKTCKGCWPECNDTAPMMLCHEPDNKQSRKRPLSEPTTACMIAVDGTAPPPPNHKHPRIAFEI